MIVASAPAISAAQAAQRLARVGGVVWSRTPRRHHLHEVVTFVAAAPSLVVQSHEAPQLEQAWQQAQQAWRCDEAEVPVAFGSLTYDWGMPLVGGRYHSQSPSGWPAMEFRFYDAVLEIGPSGDTRILAQNVEAAARLQDGLREGLRASAITVLAQELAGPLVSAEPAEAYLAGVERVAAYLRAGDVYQVNLARRLEARVCDAGTATGLSLALALNEQAPAPFGFWLGPSSQSPGRALVGNSPERFLRRTPSGLLQTCPIKGTRRRSQAAAEQDPQAEELAQSPKDRAEHDMIVDLERNDLGRVCNVGSVSVIEHARTLHLPTVHHLVSLVQGQQRPDVGLLELMQATFPGGSITGAPKRRAMEIISEIETAARGPYTGATGWLGAAGDFDLAVAIRTATISDQKLTLWVGGGIVADSVPEAELAETDAKALAFARLWRDV